MSAHTLSHDWLIAPFVIADPGEAGTFDLANKGFAIAVLSPTGAATRTVPAPESVNQRFTACLDKTQTTTITITGGATGVASRVLTTAGQYLSLIAVSVDGVVKWAVAASGNGQSVVGAALTTPLTTITPADAVGTPDYAVAAITNTSPFGFSNAAEAITILYVIKNLQTRQAEMESRLQVAGVIA